MARHEVYISDEGLAAIDGEPLDPAPGQSVHEAVLDQLQQYAVRQAGAVQAAVDDRTGTGHFVLEVSPDGSSRLLTSTQATPAGPQPGPGPVLDAAPGPAPAREPAPAPEQHAEPAPAPTTTTGTSLEPGNGPEPGPGPVLDAAPGPAPAREPAPAPEQHAEPAPAPTTTTGTGTGPEPGPGSAPASGAAIATAVARATAAARAAAARPTAVRTAAVPRTDMPRTDVAPPAAPAPPAVILPSALAGRIGHINALAAADRLDEAYALATELRENLTAAEGADDPHAVEARAVEAYIAHLRGDHREAVVLALGVARIRCRAGDPRAPEEVARAAAAWQWLDDDRAAAVHGYELLHMWDRLEQRGLLPQAHAELAGQIRRRVDTLTAYV